MYVFGNQEGWLSGARGGCGGKLAEQVASSAFCLILGRLRYILDWQCGEVSELLIFLFQGWLETKGLIWLMVLELLVHGCLAKWDAGAIQQCEALERCSPHSNQEAKRSRMRGDRVPRVPYELTSSRTHFFWRFHFLLNRLLTHKLSETFKI